MEKLKAIKPVLDEARVECKNLRHDYVSTEHVLLGLCAREGALLSRLGARPLNVREHIARLVQIGRPCDAGGNRDQFPLTPRVKKALDLAEEEAKKHKAEVTPAFLVVGLIREFEGIAAVVLCLLGVTEAKALSVAISEALVHLRFMGGPPHPANECGQYGERHSEDENEVTCPQCKERWAEHRKNLEERRRHDAPCEHVQKFLEAVRGLYAKDHHFVTLDEPINAHCHNCSSIFKIPEALLRNKQRESGEPAKGRVLSVQRYVTRSISVNTPEGKKAVELQHPISLWELIAEYGVGVWEETYATEKEKDAFVRGYRAACWMHSDPDPEIREER